MNLPAKSVFFILAIAALVAGACSSSGNENSAPTNTNIRDTERLQDQTIPSEQIQISAGLSHSCVTLQDGTVWCWGRNGGQFSGGRLGNGTTTHSSVPVQVSAITTATQVSAGWDHSCATLQDGTVWCWGSNEYNEFGDGTRTGSSVPVQASGITTATQVSAGSGHSCAVLKDGTVWCWGVGELGDGISSYSAVPVQVFGITTATGVSVGNSHSCAVLQDGTVWCWGSNSFGQLGDGTGGDYDHSSDSSFPVQVSEITTATQVSAGSFHSCATLQDGTVWCWGDNWPGQLGNGRGIFSEDHSSVPVQVSEITTATQVSAGDFHSCATLQDGTVWCWGSNSFGQLGKSTRRRGYFGNSSAVPVQVSEITTATQVSAGDFGHSCASLQEGTVWCWGSNLYGQLGNNTEIDNSVVPLQVSGIPAAQ